MLTTKAKASTAELVPPGCGLRPLNLEGVGGRGRGAAICG